MVKLTQRTGSLRPEPQPTRAAPHGALGEGAGQPAAGRGPGGAGERPGVDADARQLLLQRRQVAVVYQAEDVQEAEQGERRPQVPAGRTRVRFGFSARGRQGVGGWGDSRERGEVNVVAATQGQMQQRLELSEDREAVGHQQSAVTGTQRHVTAAVL